MVKGTEVASASTNIMVPTKNITIKEERLGPPNGATYIIWVQDQAQLEKKHGERTYVLP